MEKKERKCRLREEKENIKHMLEECKVTGKKEKNGWNK